MATVTHAATATWSTTAGTTTTPTNVFTPAVGDLILVIAPSTGVASSTCTDNNADGLGTYTKVGSTFTGFSTAGSLTVWVRNALIGSATSTTVTTPQNGSTGGGLDCFRISGMTRTGLNAIRQVAGQSSGTAASTPAPAFGFACDTSNPVIGAVANGTSPATLTPRGSPAYTEATDLGYSTPTTGVETMFISSGETASTITWGGTSASAFASVAVELDTSLIPGTRPVVVGIPGIRQAGKTLVVVNPPADAEPSGASVREGRFGRSVPPEQIVIRNPVGGPAAVTATGSLTLTGTATVSASAAATGSITLSPQTVVVTGFNATPRPLVVFVEPPPRQLPPHAIVVRNPQTMADLGTASGTITLTGTATVAGFSVGEQPVVVRTPGLPHQVPPRAFLTRNPQAAGSATATGSITLTGTASVAGAATATGSITLTGTATLLAGTTGRQQNINQALQRRPPPGQVIIVRPPQSQATITASGSLTLTGAASASAGAAATGSITLTGAATLVSQDVSAGASDRLGRWGRSIPAVTLILRNSGPGPTAAFGSIQLIGSTALKAVATASGTITLLGTGNLSIPTPAPNTFVADQGVASGVFRYRAPYPAIQSRNNGGVEALATPAPEVVGQAVTSAVYVHGRVLRPSQVVSPKVSAPGALSASGSITLTGTATAKAVAAAAGSITLNGTAAVAAIAVSPTRVVVEGQAIQAGTQRYFVPHPALTPKAKPSVGATAATGSIQLTGSAAASVRATAAGSVTLTGTAAARARVNSATGFVTLTASAAAKARAAAVGFITLSGVVFLVRRDLSLSAVVEGSRLTAAVESAHLTGTVEGTRLSGVTEGS